MKSCDFLWPRKGEWTWHWSLPSRSAEALVSDPRFSPPSSVIREGDATGRCTPGSSHRRQLHRATQTCNEPLCQRADFAAGVCFWMYLGAFAWMCACVCVCERKRERKRERKIDTISQTTLQRNMRIFMNFYKLSKHFRSTTSFQLEYTQKVNNIF